MTVAVFGEIISKAAMKRAVLKHLEKWMPTYLCEVDEQEGVARGTTAWPNSFQRVPRFNNELLRQLPAIMVVCPGTIDRPVKYENGMYHATYAVGVAALCKAADSASTIEVADRYAAAIGACMLQDRGNIDPRIMALSWDGDSDDNLAVDSTRTLSSTIVHFRIMVQGVVSDRPGPSAPFYGEPSPEPKVEPKTEPQRTPPGPIPDEGHIQVTITPRST